MIDRSLISPQVYASVGINPRHGTETAPASGNRQEIMRQSARKLMDFLEDAGTIRGPSRRLWVRSGLLAR